MSDLLSFTLRPCCVLFTQARRSAILWVAPHACDLGEKALGQWTEKFPVVLGPYVRALALVPLPVLPHIPCACLGVWLHARLHPHLSFSASDHVRTLYSRLFHISLAVRCSVNRPTLRRERTMSLLGRQRNHPMLQTKTKGSTGSCV